MDSVRPASKSSIELDFYYRNVRCRPRLKMAPTPKNIKYAENLLGKIKIDIAKNEFDFGKYFPNHPLRFRFSDYEGDRLLMKDYLNTWLKNNSKYWKQSTYKGYKKVVDGRLIPAFGNYTLSEINRKMVRDWISEQDISYSTLSNIISPLRVALNEALEDGLIKANPLVNWTIKKKKTVSDKQSEIDPFSFKEMKTILDILEGQNKNLIQFWFWTGLRPSELVALNWTDVDWPNSRVYVNKAMTQAATEFEEPKTGAGNRAIELLAPALEALKRQREHTQLKGKEIFQNPRTGERWTGDQPIRRTLWQPALKRAGVRYRYPYQCRHTFASMVLQAGESVQWVASQMGHTTWTFTATTYSRFIPDNTPDRGKKIEAQWSNFGKGDDDSRQ